MLLKYSVEVLEQREWEDKVDMITFLTFNNNNVLKKEIPMDPYDYLGGVQAMISRDIYKSSKQNIDTISAIIKADLLVIVAAQDHVVHPSSASQLAKKLAAPLVTLMGDCGHVAFACESEKVKTAVTKFLKRN